MELLKASPRWAGNFTGTHCREQYPRKGDGGNGYILDLTEGEDEAEQFVSDLLRNKFTS